MALEIFDVAGKRIRTLSRVPPEQSRWTIRWDGRNETGRPTGAGVFFCRLESGGVVRSGRVVQARSHRESGFAPPLREPLGDAGIDFFLFGFVVDLVIEVLPSSEAASRVCFDRKPATSSA